ncbi:MAG TPA: FmdB family zinc ribbon protein [Aridibacter sp.]|nr:FmdB family zinc ribbon protein [Aridibacter sp.]
MPIYEYKCLGCGAHLEKIQKASDEPLKTCEQCGGELAKQWSLSGFQFKGEGWYVTDYASKKNGDSASKDGEPASKESSKAGESTDSPKAASQGETRKEGTPEGKPEAKSDK